MFRNHDKTTLNDSRGKNPLNQKRREESRARRRDRPWATARSELTSVARPVGAAGARWRERREGGRPVPRPVGGQGPGAGGQGAGVSWVGRSSLQARPRRVPPGAGAAAVRGPAEARLACPSHEPYSSPGRGPGGHWE